MNRVEHLHREALAHHLNHDLNRAIMLWEKVIKHDPVHTRAGYALIRLYIECSSFSKAKALCEQMVSSVGDALSFAGASHYFQAVFEVQQGLLAGERAWALNSNCHEAAYARYTSLLFSGREFEANGFIKSLGPDFFSMPEFAVERACDPKFPPLEQLKLMDGLIKQFPHCRTARFSRLAILNRIRNYTDFRREFDWLVSKSPQNAEVYAVGALNAFELGRVDEARAFTVQALTLNPKAVLAHFVHLSLDWDMGQADLVRDRLDLVRSFVAGTICQWTLLPQMMQICEQSSSLVDMFRCAFDEGALSPEVHIALARFEAEGGGYEQAELYLRLALESWPDHRDIILEVAQLAFERGQTKRVREILSAIGVCERADTLQLELNNIEGASLDAMIKSYESHLKTYPSFDFAWGRLLRIFLETHQDNGVEWLLNFPYAVPAHVRSAVYAYQGMVAGRPEVVNKQLEMFLSSRTVDKRWQWCWELILETLDDPSCAHYLPIMAEAARADGL